MEELLFLAQRTTRQAPNASFATSVMVGMVCGGLILLAMFISSIWALVRWPDPGASRIAIALPLLALPFTGWIVGGVYRLAGEQAPGSMIFLVPVGWVIWIAVFMYARTQISNADKAGEWAEAERRAKARRGPPLPRGPHAQGNAPRMPLQGGAPQASQMPQPGSAPAQPAAPVQKPQPRISPETAVIARCTACMGRWKTTAGEAKELEACPKCGASPPELRLQRA